MIVLLQHAELVTKGTIIVDKFWDSIKKPFFFRLQILRQD